MGSQQLSIADTENGDATAFAALTMLQSINAWLIGQHCKVGAVLVPTRARPRSYSPPLGPQRSGPPLPERGQLHGQKAKDEKTQQG